MPFAPEEGTLLRDSPRTMNSVADALSSARAASVNSHTIALGYVLTFCRRMATSLFRIAAELPQP